MPKVGDNMHFTNTNLLLPYKFKLYIPYSFDPLEIGSNVSRIHQ